MTATAVARAIAVVAVILIVSTGALASGFSPLAIPFILFALVPYGVLYLAGRFASNPWVIGGAGVAALTVELGVRASVMLYPRGSTAGIALVFSPLLIGLIVMPIGAVVGGLFGYVFARTGPVVQAVSMLAAIIAVGLTFIFFARPEMFPTTVATRRSHLAAIGEPRIVAGADRFRRTTVSDLSAWRVVGEFDEQPGEDLAIVDHKGAQLFDAVSLQPTRFIVFGGEPGRLWNGYSQLARVGDSLVVVQTGGGFQETQVMSLNNDLLWRFHPDPKLPPTALLPGDIDGDGEIEFYASTAQAITRLDAKGQAVWSKPATLPRIVALVPPRDGVPGWVVSTRHDAGYEILSPDGTGLAIVKGLGPLPVHGVVTWPFDSAQGTPEARHLLAGDTTVKGIDVKGVTAYEMPIDEGLRLMQALVWKPDTGPALLAVLAGGDRDLKRWRLRVYQSPDAVVYDEVFDQPPRLLVANHADGTSTLFVAVGSTLSALTPQRN
jgi:hypothetical protein